MDTARRTGLDAAITASKKLVHKTPEATGELIRNKIAKKVVEPKSAPDENSRNIKETNISPEKRQEILHELRRVKCLNY